MSPSDPLAPESSLPGTKSEAAPQVRDRLLSLSEQVHSGERAQAAQREVAQTDALRRLTVAIWVLAAVTSVSICISLFALFSQPPFSTRRAEGFSRGSWVQPPISSSSSSVSKMMEEEEKLEGFHDWPLQKRIDAASVVAIARFEKRGDRLKAVITEVLKKSAQTDFYYKVGDEYVEGGRQIEPNTKYGDGMIVFFVGSPARMKYAMSFHGDRVGGLGDMPLEALREMTAKK